MITKMGLVRIRKATPSKPSYSIYRNLCRLYFLLLSVSLFGCAHAKIGYFWHITDLHLDTRYSTKGDIIRNCWHFEHDQGSSAGRYPGRYGDYLCDSPWSLLESATLAMKSRQGDNVEFVLWTGDGLAHSARRLLESHRMDILRNITELLRQTFSSQFVFPVIGHEDGTNSNFYRLAVLWKHWLPTEALQTFEKGGYYTIEQKKSRLRIIVLNTNFMRHDPKYVQSHLAAVRQRQSSNMGMSNGRMDSDEYNNYYYHRGSHHYRNDMTNHGYTTSGGQVSALSGYDSDDTQKQWDWLESVLAKSSSDNKTVYIVGHIPPGSDERHVGSQQNGHTTFSEKNNARYLRLVRKYSSIIQGQFFGHLHSDSFRIIYNDMGTPVSWIMISPSVTPRKINIGSNNPAMRLYKFDTDSGQVLDYTQYYLDLDAANTLSEANWQPEYNLTTHYYGLADVSALSLHNLADRFTNNENPLFAKYYRANSVRYPTQQCEGVCALNHYCAITRVDYREFGQCLETAASALSSHSSQLIFNTTNPSSLLLLLTSLLLTMNTLRKLLFLRIMKSIHCTMGLAAKILLVQKSIKSMLRKVYIQQSVLYDCLVCIKYLIEIASTQLIQLIKIETKSSNRHLSKHCNSNCCSLLLPTSSKVLTTNMKNTQNYLQQEPQQQQQKSHRLQLDGHQQEKQISHFTTLQKMNQTDLHIQKIKCKTNVHSFSRMICQILIVVSLASVKFICRHISNITAFILITFFLVNYHILDVTNPNTQMAVRELTKSTKIFTYFNIFITT